MKVAQPNFEVGRAPDRGSDSGYCPWDKGKFDTANGGLWKGAGQRKCHVPPAGTEVENEAMGVWRNSGNDGLLCFARTRHGRNTCPQSGKDDGDQCDESEPDRNGAEGVHKAVRSSHYLLAAAFPVQTADLHRMTSVLINWFLPNIP